MIKDKKEKQSSGGGSSGSSGSGGNSKSNNNANNSLSAGNSNATSSSPSATKASKNNNSSSSSASKSGIKEEIIEQSSSEQIVVTSIKHEEGSPPTNIIKKEPVPSSSSSSNAAGASGSGNANNDSNNNNDTNDNKNSNSSGNPLLPDDKDSANDNSITDDLLNNDDLNASGSGNNSNSNSKHGGMHIKSEDPATDPLAGVDSSLNNSNFSGVNSGNNSSGPNRSLMSQNSPERIQPLPSNVVNKQSNSMDYMQQQSQIFVFSTALANKGAEAVRGGQFPTIIAYHCAQPETKKFLQKFPLKVNQFNRSGWFPPNMPPNMNNSKKPRMMPMNQQNFNFMKNNQMNPQQLQQQQPGNGPMNNQMGMQGFPSSCDMNNPDGNMMMWPGNQQQMNIDPLGNNGPSLDPLLNDPIDSLVNDPLGSQSHHSPMCMNPTSPSIPSLQGVKVPDAELTLEQRASRAYKLNKLQTLKQLFKQEPQSLNPNECQMNDQDVPQSGPDSCAKMNQTGPNPMMQGGENHQGPMNQMNGPMRPNFPMGMGPGNPRGNMMQRPMGPGGMHPNLMNDDMMGSPMSGPCSGPMNSGNMQMGSGGMMGNMNMQHMQGNNMGLGNCNMGGMNNMGMMGQKMPPNMMGGPPAPGNMQAHMEWNKLQQQYYDESKRKGPMMGPMDMNSEQMCRQMPPAMRNMPNMRGPGPGQGPPPPYHQTPRSASVPIAVQSPNPNSPNNPTSNLSLPSPRGGCNSTLNSPAGGDPNRPMNQQHMKHMNPRQSPTTSQDSPVGPIGRQINHSNPSTPISSHLSPSASLKDLEMNNNPNKEPNLMPVPSPQQISYLNTFESQELTIQKQPNTNIKDGCSNIGGPNQGNLDNRLAGQKTPTSSAGNPHMNNFPIPSSPHTPGGSSIPGDKNRINSSGPSPQNNLQRSNSMMGNDIGQFQPHQHSNNQQQSNESNMQFPSDTPNMPFGPNSQQNNLKMGNFMDHKPGDMGNNGPPPQFAPCSGRPDLPLNPNSNATMTNPKPSSHFDPISSLAQMSQQLSTSGVPMNGQPMMGGFNNNGMMNDMGQMGMEGQMGPAGQMDFGGMIQNQYGGPRSMSPKIGGPQMGFPGPGQMQNMRMVRPMGYNGTNIQVKPNAPNTIQYLPARPQMNNSNPPRGPPSLDFLQRFTNPMGMDEMNKGGQQNMPYFPNQNNPSCGMDPLDGNVNQMGGPGNGPMMNQNPMMMRGMRGNGGGNMMRFPGPQGPGGGGNPCMMGNNFNSSNMGGDHQMMFGGPGGQQNPQMFVAGPKGSPMSGPPNPEQMQMMSGPGGGPPPHFKQQQQQQQQSHFPSTNDPNYAQQYHNFQQQLYATNNTQQQRNQMGMGGNQAQFMPK